MEFEWDEDKRESTIARHGIGFQDAITIFAGPVMSLGLGHGEPRVMHVGILDGREIVVITTLRDGRLRVVTVRRARINERKTYLAHVAARGTATPGLH